MVEPLDPAVVSNLLVQAVVGWRVSAAGNVVRVRLAAPSPTSPTFQQAAVADVQADGRGFRLGGPGLRGGGAERAQQEDSEKGGQALQQDAQGALSLTCPIRCWSHRDSRKWVPGDVNIG